MAKKKTKRSEDISRRPAIKKRLLDLYKDVEKGFVDQRDRGDDIADNWDAYNCVLGGRQFYNGTSQLFLPFIKDAVEARVTRFANQIFPQSGRYCEVTTFEEDHPQATMALLEWYVDICNLRTEIVPALIRCGDIEGQYSIYVDWEEFERHIARREQQPLVSAGVEVEGADLTETVEEQVISDGTPVVSVIPDGDLLILPVTCDSPRRAIARGGSVTVLRRWSKSQLKEMMAEGDIDRTEGELLIKRLESAGKDPQRDTAKDLAEAAGVKGGGKYILGYETWTNLKVDGDWRLCRAYFGGEKQVLGAKLCPYWCDESPVLSCPATKMPNVAKGPARVSDVLGYQILANDTINEAADSAHMSAFPVTMTDPNQNPRIDSMVMAPGAIWATNPQTTQFAQFPEVWRSGLERCEAIKAQIFQSLGVNPSMVPQSSSSKRKMNQAEMANEQAVDILTTADSCTILEKGILSPLLQRFADYDHQFREKAIAVPMWGDFGEALRMEEVEPIQLDRRYQFKWLGVELARNAAKLQQQIAGLNVIMKLPKDAYPGYKLNIAPLLVNMAESLWGPRTSRLVLEDMRKQLSVDPNLENEMLVDGFLTHVHPGDDDAQHLEVHMGALKEGLGDPHGTIRAHIQEHQQQMQMKVAAATQAQQQGPQRQQGRGPAPGAQPGAQRGVKGPPGMMHQDRLPAAGAAVMPRKF